MRSPTLRQIESALKHYGLQALAAILECIMGAGLEISGFSTLLRPCPVPIRLVFSGDVPHVTDPIFQAGQIQLMIDEVIERVFEGAGR